MTTNFIINKAILRRHILYFIKDIIKKQFESPLSSKFFSKSTFSLFSYTQMFNTTNYIKLTNLFPHFKNFNKMFIVDIYWILGQISIYPF